MAIQGSGWYSPLRYDAAALKANPEVSLHAEGFAAAGYTVFVINHRQAPRFRYPADEIIFSVGTFSAFFNSFHGLFLKPEDRVQGGLRSAPSRR